MIAAFTGEKELWGVMSSFQVISLWLFPFFFFFLKYSSRVIIFSAPTAQWSLRWSFWLGEKPCCLVSLSNVKEAEAKQQTMKSRLHCWGLPKDYLSNKAFHLSCVIVWVLLKGQECFFIVRQTLAANLGCNNCLCSRYMGRDCCQI